MKHDTLITLLLVGSFGAAACAGEDTASTTTELSFPVVSTTAPATTSTAPAATSTTTSPVAVIEYAGGATYVTGVIADFRIDDGTIETDADGVQHSRGGHVAYRLVSDDPRVAGTVVGTWNTDRWGEYTAGVLTQWGETTLTNEGGTWEASYQGGFASPAGDVTTRWWRGTGDYEGLTFYMWTANSPPGASIVTWGGIIVPGDPPPGTDR